MKYLAFCFCLFLSAMPAFAGEPRTVRITISPETTCFMEPRLPDGRIDYYTAINRENAVGVEPDDNLIIGLFRLVPGEMEYVLLREAGNPDAAAERAKANLFREQFWKELGFDAPPPLETLRHLDPGRNLPGRDFHKELLEVYSQEELDARIRESRDRDRRYFKERFETGKIDKDRYEAELKKLDAETAPREYREIVNGEWTQAMRKVWTEKDCPYLARWMPSTDDTTEKLIELSRRTDYFCPVVRTDGTINLYENLLPYTQYMRHVVRFLQYRGNWDFGRGDHDRAFECAFSSIRMGRAVRKGAGTVVEELLGIAFEGVGNYQVTTCLVELKDKKNAAWFLAGKKKYDALYPAIGDLPAPPKWNLGERCMMLSAIQLLAFDPPGFKRFLETCYEKDAPELKAFDRIFDPDFAYDWDRILRDANSRQDECEDCMAIGSLRRRIRATDRLERRGRVSREKLIDEGVATGDRNRDLSEYLSDVFLPALNALSQAQCRIEWDRRVTSLAFALAAYRADHGGGNPDSLDRLVPRYVEAVPESPFTEKPMRYLKREKDCLVTNDDYWKLDGGEPEVEKSIAETAPGRRAYPEPTHFIFVVGKTE